MKHLIMLFLLIVSLFFISIAAPHFLEINTIREGIIFFGGALTLCVGDVLIYIYKKVLGK